MKNTFPKGHLTLYHYHEKNEKCCKLSITSKPGTNKDVDT